jgi:hypothetical protein
MPEDNAVHPGSFVGDSIEEFKKLPTWGKVLAVAALALVAFLAIRAKMQSAQQAASSTASSPDTSGTVAGSQSPFPNINGLPLLPSGVNPIYDANGNPIAYQQAPTATPPPVTPTTAPLPQQPNNTVINTKKPLAAFAGNNGNSMNSTASTTPHITSAVPQARPTVKPPAPPPEATKPPWWSILGGTYSPPLASQVNLANVAGPNQMQQQQQRLIAKNQ